MKTSVGFSCYSATVTALLEATDYWEYNIDIAKINAVIFLDLKKAVDTVGHKVLVSKLDFYGISGNSLKWLQSYLGNRIQQCSGIGGSFTDGRGLTRVVSLRGPSSVHSYSYYI